MVNVAVNVLAELGQATWTTPRAIGYETVLEGVRQSIGFYSQSIATEEQSDEPDTGAIELGRSEQLSWATRAQELIPLDTRATESLLEDAEKLLEDDDDDDEDESDDEDSDDEDESDDEA
ncbi:hypothetical protein [Kribbella sindirgiensis]|uniref:hypothetical protein n=1 Tax=Kribbella sindirgiensis TaxID=1124744 RepID=UPI00192D3766|nr:hypothetical protein [Kribbella sindirgiensis]